MITLSTYANGYTLAANDSLSITNTGSIGGAGLLAMDASSIDDSGSISVSGGADGTGSANGVTGNAGVTLQDTAGFSDRLGSSIKGGAGGDGGNGGYGSWGGVWRLGGGGGDGGAGIAGTSLSLSNAGNIVGGAGGDVGIGGGPNGAPSDPLGGIGGAGVSLSVSAIVNTGTVRGGQGGSGAFGGPTTPFYFNSGAGGSGGVGVSLDAGSILNSGQIFGGAGGYGGGRHTGGAGGAAVALTGGVLYNSAGIVGGAGGDGAECGFDIGGAAGAGGAGIAASGGVLSNSGSVIGGAGGEGGYGANVAWGSTVPGGTGGAGGNGVALAAGVFTNFGKILGGAGGLGGPAQTSPGGHGGDGGAGVLVAEGTLVNSGRIFGGAAGQGNEKGRRGLAGDGVDITASGRVTNGAAGNHSALIEGKIGVDAHPGASMVLTNYGEIIGHGGIAVDFQSSTDVLAVEAGSSFTGSVLGGGGILRLASGDGAIAGLGGYSLTISKSMTATDFLAFDTVEISKGGNFIDIDGGSVDTGQTLIVAGRLATKNTLADEGSVTVIGALAGVGTFAIDGGTANFGEGARLAIARVAENSVASSASFSATHLSTASVWAQSYGRLSVGKGDQLYFTGVGNLFAGTLAGAGTITFSRGSDILDGTTLSIAKIVVTGAEVTLSGGIQNDTDIVITGHSLLVASGGVTLTGGGSITLGDSPTTNLRGVTAGATLNNLDSTIAGAGELGGGQMTLENGALGTIDGNGRNALLIDTGANIVDNFGRIESTGTGGLIVESAVNNSGVLAAQGGHLTVEGMVTGGGTVIIDGGAADFTSVFSENVSFSDDGVGILELSRSRFYTGTIYGFSKSGATSIDLDDIAFGPETQASYAGTKNAGVLTVSDGDHKARFKLSGDYRASDFEVASDGHGGVTVADFAPTTVHLLLAAMANLAPSASGEVSGWRAPSAVHALLATPAHSG